MKQNRDHDLPYCLAVVDEVRDHRNLFFAHRERPDDGMVVRAVFGHLDATRFEILGVPYAHCYLLEEAARRHFYQ